MIPRSVIALIPLLMVLPKPLKAAIVGADTLTVSTIGGQGASNGITISSYVYMTSGSSMTLQGSGGYVTASSSINASAFFGDGSNLSGVGFLAATQTFSGSNTFMSSFTIQSGGRQIILSTSTTVNNLQLSSAGIVSFFPEMHNSSSTVISAGTTTNTTFGPCIVGSTLTIRTSGGRVEVHFTDSLYNFGSGKVGVNFLVDGKYARDLTNTKGFGAQINSVNYQFVEDIDYLLDPLPAGQHSFCITVDAPTGGTTNFSGRGGAASDIFYVEEIK